VQLLSRRAFQGRTTPLDASRSDLVDEEVSQISELCGSPGCAPKAAATLMIAFMFAIFGFGGFLIAFSLERWERSCDEPLQYFTLVYGGVYVLHGSLLLLQFFCRYSEGLMSCIAGTSYLPSIAEIVLLILGSYWYFSSKRCNEELRDGVWIILIILYGMLGLSIVFKLYRWCVAPAAPRSKFGV